MKTCYLRGKELIDYCIRVQNNHFFLDHNVCDSQYLEPLVTSLTRDGNQRLKWVHIVHVNILETTDLQNVVSL